MKRLEGRAAIITGAGGGMGAATAERLVAEGARVLAVDLPHRLTAGPASDAIVPHPADLRDLAGLQGIVDAALTAFGGLDILVNNAGVTGALDGGVFGTEENWQFVMAVNLDAPRHLSRLAIEPLKRSKAGRIINLGSVASEFPSRGGAPAYDVSKHAIYGLTRNMAMNFGQFGITVNAVLPGGVDSPMTRAYPFYDAFEKLASEHSALGRIGKPEDIAAAIAFLASDDAAYITGHGLYVDGGIHLSI